MQAQPADFALSSAGSAQLAASDAVYIHASDQQTQDEYPCCYSGGNDCAQLRTFTANYCLDGQDGYTQVILVKSLQKEKMFHSLFGNS